MSESNLIVSHLTFHEPPPSFQFWGEGSRLLLTIRASGELVFAPDARPEEAVRVLMDAWSRMLPQSALRTAVTAERQRETHAPSAEPPIYRLMGAAEREGEVVNTVSLALPLPDPVAERVRLPLCHTPLVVGMQGERYATVASFATPLAESANRRHYSRVTPAPRPR